MRSGPLKFTTGPMAALIWAQLHRRLPALQRDVNGPHELPQAHTFTGVSPGIHVALRSVPAFETNT